MVTSEKSEIPVCHLKSKGENIKQVNNFKYLGYTLTANGKCILEVKKRIAIAKEAFYRMKPIMKNKCISLKTKFRIMKAYIWSILLYGCESWTIDREIMNRIEAVEMWFLRRILGISWKEKVRNEEVLKRAGTKRELIEMIRKRQLSFLGHVYRKDDIERTVLTGRIDGKRDRGRQRLTYLQSLNNWATKGTKSLTDFLRTTERREDWRLMSVDVFKT